MSEVVYDRQGAAAALKISVPELDRLIRRGDLAHLRIGRLVRVPDAAIRDFIASRTTRSTRAA